MNLDSAIYPQQLNHWNDLRINAIALGFRYPAGIISQMVWLYFRFSLSFRDIEQLMASRGIVVTYETIRQWTPNSARCTQTGCMVANPGVAINRFSTRSC